MDDDFKDLLAIDALSSSGAEALKTFCMRKNIGANYFESALKILYGPLTPEIPVKALPGAREVLTRLIKEYTLAIVSVGEETQQLSKLKKAGIDSSFFYKILCVKEGEKKLAYECLLEKRALEEVLVCGDKVLTDLKPAKELGCITVHMRRGRGRVYAGPSADVDFTISEFSEIEFILSILRSRGQ